MPARLASAQKIHWPIGRAFGSFSTSYDKGRTACAGTDNLQQVQGINDHARVEHVVDDDLFTAEQGRWILTSVLALIDSDLGHLLRLGAKFGHMAPGNQGIARIGGNQ